MNHHEPSHVHPPSVQCFLDCPGWRLLCGHSLDECHPECPRWAGMTAEEARAHGRAVLDRIGEPENTQSRSTSGDAA
jgi:hypothetical protein